MSTSPLLDKSSVSLITQLFSITTNALSLFLFICFNRHMIILIITLERDWFFQFLLQKFTCIVYLYIVIMNAMRVIY